MPVIALVTDQGPGELDTDRARSEDLLAVALREHGVTVERLRWHEVGAHPRHADLVVIRQVALDPARRETFLAWARSRAATAPLFNPLEVLRWGSHRSFLLELEERGTPLVPTAWLGRGDTIDLDALVGARGWEQARIVPAVAGPAAGQAAVGAGACGVAAGQGALDRLLAVDDVLVQEAGPDGASMTGCLVVDGRASHLVRGGVEVQEAEAAALAEWVVEATGVDLLFARVDLVRDQVGTWQVVDVDAVAPHLELAASPAASRTVADAILRRLA